MNMKNLRVCFVSIFAVTLLASGGQAVGQVEDVACMCGSFGTCDIGDYEAITNLENPKPPDLVLCASDAFPGACEAYWKNRGVAVQRVSTVQEAADAIVTAAGAGKINVFVHGHGASGLQCFGPDPECIGNNPPYDDNKNDFVGKAAGKIKNFYMMGCSAAADPKGQAFLKKLAAELDTGIVKGFTGTNQMVYWYTPGNPGTECIVDDDCANAQVCKASQCATVIVKGEGTTARYETVGEKKAIPAVTSWGLAVMLLLVAAAGTLVIRRSRAIA